MKQAIVSGKAKNLRLLSEAGFPVPPFFVIPAAELEACAGENPVAFDKLVVDLYQRESAFFGAHSLFAVRSSAAGEDSLDSSMAGLYRSMLDVEPVRLADALRQCWDGQRSEQIRLIREKQRAGTKAMLPDLDLIVQAMVPDVKHSAILFTSNPDGLLNERVLVVGEGLGNLLVADQIPAISYYRHAQEGSGYYENPYELALVKPAVLAGIWALADRVEERFGPALDLELAMNGAGEIFLLQMRPITTLDRHAYDVPGTILDNSNIVESYPGLTLPLSTDFYRRAYHGVFDGLIKRLLPKPPAKAAGRLDEIAANMVFSRNGRAYYQLNNWLLLLRHLPFRRQILPVWREMMGVEKLATEEESPLIGPFARMGMLIRLLRAVGFIDRYYRQLVADVKQIEAEYRLLESRPFVPELYEVFFTRIADTLLNHWDITLVNDLLAMVRSGRLKKKATALGIKDANRLLSGFAALTSMEPVRSLTAIRAKMETIDPALLANAAEDDATARLILSAAHPALQFDAARRLIAEMNEHINLYGDRSIEELKLERHTQRSKPGLFFAALQAARTSETEAAVHVEERIDFTRLRKMQTKAQEAIMRREESRLLRTRVYGIVRSMFTRMGHELLGRALLDEPADVFYLKIDEVFSAFHIAADLRATVVRRKAAYRIYQDLPAYGRLIFAGEPFSNQKAAHQLNQAIDAESISELGGTPSSPGIVQGEVLLIHDAAAARNIAGKILVCRSTDPGWVYMMLQAKGIVAERGSILSHTAIISRELALPSVVGVKDATAILRDGDLIEVNGTSGMIRILKRNEGKDS